MKMLRKTQLKRSIMGILTGLCILGVSASVYAAELKEPKPVSQEIIEAAEETARNQAETVTGTIHKKAEAKRRRKLEEEARQAEKAAAQAAEEARKARRQEIVDYAMQFVGNPYVYGGTSLTNGADCSGFVQAVFGNFGYSLPRVAGDQAYSGIQKTMDKLEKGDLIFYGSASYITHVALYIGDGQIVHASNAATGIKVSEYNYQQPYMTATYLD